MKTPFYLKTSLLALAATLFVATGYRSLATEASPPPQPADAVLPAGIPLGSPVGQVFKLVQAGMDIGVIQNYISNCPSAFNLDADSIIALSDAGLPPEIVNAMFAHDKTLPAVATAPAAPVEPAAAPEQAAAPVASSDTTTTPVTPGAELNIVEVNQSLAPYGTWVEIDGYGRCWRPNVILYDAGWRPYCDRGRWVYTDCGWYWDSEYSWGVTFHFGRWYNSPQYGWCWWPDRVWAPSWVTWRSSTAYCGWAPLPPFTVYNPGVGFCYRGNNVSIGFGFGLTSSCFTFVTAGNFCQPHPRYYCVPKQQVNQIYSQTTIINNYGHNNHIIVNNGVSVTTIGTASRHPIQPVPISTLINPDRHGWHGQSPASPGHHFSFETAGSSASHQSGYQHNVTTQNNNHRPANGSPSQTATVPANRHDQHNPGFTGGNTQTSPRPTQSTATPSAGRDQHETAFFSHNTTAPVPHAPSTAPASNRAFTPSPVRNTTPTTSFPSGNNDRQFTRTYTTPSRPVVTESGAPVVSQRTPPVANSGGQWQQRSPQPTYTAPAVTVNVPQHSEPRQSVAASAPHNVAPSAPAMSSSHSSGRNQNSGGNSQNWTARNH